MHLDMRLDWPDVETAVTKLHSGTNVLLEWMLQSSKNPSLYIFIPCLLDKKACNIHHHSYNARDLGECYKSFTHKWQYQAFFNHRIDTMYAQLHKKVFHLRGEVSDSIRCAFCAIFLAFWRSCKLRYKSLKEVRVLTTRWWSSPQTFFLISRDLFNMSLPRSPVKIQPRERKVNAT